jgi:deazaflavin-dependent oxidoreductase (nitroreductase family)
MDSINDFNKTLIEDFRANGGKVSGQFANTNLLLLNTIGAKSGQTRTNPVAYTTDGDRFIVMASKGGAPTHPDWYYNLSAHPTVKVEVGQDQFEARATIAEGAERERLFNQMVAVMPGFGEYQRNIERQIPVIILERVE